MEEKVMNWNKIKEQENKGGGGGEYWTEMQELSEAEHYMKGGGDFVESLLFLLLLSPRISFMV